MYARVDFPTLSLMDALDLAILIEEEAYQRYTNFSSQIGPADAGLFFKSMAENEAKHGKELLERRKVLFGDAFTRVDISDLFDVEAPEVGSIRRTMSVLQAFEVAVSAERKAYGYFDQALPQITDPDVHALFVELRDEEKEHIRMVQEAMEKLPPSASFEGEIDYDETPYL
jgi:erythrin-vacuolar iron transport family protein